MKTPPDRWKEKQGGSRMKVEAFTGFTENGLSRKINKFIKRDSVKVIEIKFSSTLFYMSALVIYNDKE